MAIDQSIQQKRSKEEEIARLLSEEVRSEEEMNVISARNLSMKKEIERRKQLLQAKRTEMDEMRRARATKKKQISSLKTWEAAFGAQMAKRAENPREVQLARDEEMEKLEQTRILMCRFLLGTVYPAKAAKRNGVDVYSVRSAHLPSSLLSIRNRSRPDSSSLALLAFATHIFKIMSRILDLQLPCELVIHHYISSTEAFRSQWANLSSCVRYLCLSLDVKPTNTFNSLLALRDRLFTDGPLGLNSSLPHFASPDGDSRDDWDACDTLCQAADECEPLNDWDLCDEFAPLTASTLFPHKF